MVEVAHAATPGDDVDLTFFWGKRDDVFEHDSSAVISLLGFDCKYYTVNEPSD